MAHVDLESIIQSEVSQKEKNKYVLTNASKWNLEKCHRCSCLQGRNRDADREDKCVDTKAGRKGGRSWKTGTDACTC